MTRIECVSPFTGSVVFTESHSDFVIIKRTASVWLPCKLLYGIALPGDKANISALDHLLRLPISRFAV